MVERDRIPLYYFMVYETHQDWNHFSLSEMKGLSSGREPKASPNFLELLAVAGPGNLIAAVRVQQYHPIMDNAEATAIDDDNRRLAA